VAVSRLCRGKSLVRADALPANRLGGRRGPIGSTGGTRQLPRQFRTLMESQWSRFQVYVYANAPETAWQEKTQSFERARHRSCRMAAAGFPADVPPSRDLG
jgi:hypothetical protein